MTHRMMLLAGVAGLILAPFSALAQSAPQSAPAASSDPDVLDEVVVTAERQTRNLQTTPLAVTAIPAQQLERRGVRNVFDLQKIVPSLTVTQQTNAGGAGGASFVLRGLGGRGSSTGTEPAVALYIDDFYYPSATGNVLKALDLEQVEVLRGPQGTLFGRNAVGGAIRYQTKKPNDQFSAYVEGTVGSFDRRDVMGGVNIPLGDQLAVRLNAASLESDGFQRRQTEPGRNGASEDRIGRVQVRYTPTQDLTLDLSYEQTESELIGSPIYVPIIVTTGQVATGYNRTHTPRYDQAYASTCILCAYGSLPTPNSDVTSSRNAHFVADYRVSDALQIKFLSGYSLVKDAYFNDIDATPLLVGNQYGSPRIEAISQELQLLGDLGDRLHYVGGVYYYEETLDLFTGQTLFNGTTSVTQHRERTAASVYGNLTFDVTDKLKLTGGWRLGEEEMDTRAVTNAGVSASNSLKSDLSLPLARVQYQWTPEVMVYASASKGFRGGGFSVAPNPNLPNAGISPFRPESVWSYEVGTRAQFLDRRLRINPTVFYTDYTDIQFQRIVGTTSILDNAGDAHIFGVELESAFAVTPAFRLQATASYLEAAYDSLLPGVTNITLDTEFGKMPKWSWSVGAEYNMSLNTGAEINFNLDYSDRTKYWASAAENDRLLIAGYGLVNARIEYRTADGRYSVAAFATNLTDEHYVTGGVDLRPLVGNVRYDLGRPREIGLTLKARY